MHSLIKIKNSVKQNTLLFRMILSFIILCGVLLSSLSIIIFNEYSKTSIKDAYNTSVNMLNQTYKSTDDQLNSVYNYFSRMYMKDSLVFNALYSRTFDRTEMYDINKKLYEYVQINPLVESVYIYNRQADMVFSSKTTVKNIADFYDKDIINYIQEGKVSSYPIFIPRKVTYQIYNKEEKLQFITVIFCEYSPNNILESALIVNISQEYLSKLLSLSSDQLSNNIVVNSDGVVIINPNNAALSDNISIESYFKKIKSDTNNKGYLTFNSNNTDYFITYYKSNKILGWYFLNITKYENLIKETKKLKGYVFLITGIFILIATIISMIFTKNLYKPLHSLLRQIKARGLGPKAESTMGEYDTLNHVFTQLSTKLIDLNILLNSYKPAKKKEIIEKLLLGEIIPNSNNDEFEELQINLKSSYFVVCILKLYDFKQLSKQYSSHDIALLRFALTNISIEILQEDFYVEAIDNSKDSISLIFSLNGTNDVTEKIKEGLEKIQESSYDFLKVSIRTSMGGFVSNINNLYKSNNEAIYAINKSTIHNEKSVICYDDIATIKKTEYTYPFSIEKKIIENLKLESIDNVSQYLDRFVDHIIMYSYDEIMQSLIQLTLGIVKVANSTFNIPNVKLNSQNQNIFNELTEYETIADMKNFIIKLCMNIQGILSDKKDNKKDETINGILKNIQENYCKFDLTVDSIAQDIGLSTNHVRLLFKENVGKSISTYITEIRFTHAQRLLKETDHPAKNIAEMVGFNNTSYFYINFKKYSGYSADQYRKEFKI